MLVRIQEIYERTGDHVYSVCAGIELTARVVTSAAILLCIVLAAFLSSKILLLKYIGAVKSCFHFRFQSFAHNWLFSGNWYYHCVRCYYNSVHSCACYDGNCGRTYVVGARPT